MTSCSGHQGERRLHPIGPPGSGLDPASCTPSPRLPVSLRASGRGMPLHVKPEPGMAGSFLEGSQVM